MESFIQAKRRYKNQKKKGQKEASKITRHLKQLGFISDGWSVVYGTHFRHWRKGQDVYLEWHKPWKWNISNVNNI